MRTRRQSVRHWPARDFLAEFEPELNQPHAIEELAHNDPTLRRAYQALRRRSREVQAQVRNKNWASFSDARVLVQTLEFELAFNLGFEQGLLRGRAESFHGAARHRRRAGREAKIDSGIRALLAASDLPPDQVVATLLRFAYAFARGEPESKAER